LKRKSRKESDAELEEALGSGGRLRILKYLIKNPTNEPSLTVSRLKILTGLKRGNVVKHLETLVRWGWIEEIPIYGGKKYKLKKENSKLDILIRFFKDMEYT
jgi:DNA-binding MarR family transcriptional regulator